MRLRSYCWHLLLQLVRAAQCFCGRDVDSSQPELPAASGTANVHGLVGHRRQRGAASACPLQLLPNLKLSKQGAVETILVSHVPDHDPWSSRNSRLFWKPMCLSTCVWRRKPYQHSVCRDCVPANSFISAESSRKNEVEDCNHLRSYVPHKTRVHDLEIGKHLSMFPKVLV